MATHQSLEDVLSLSAVPLETFNQQCSDDHLLQLSQALTEWKAVSPFLGLTETEEEEIENERSVGRQRINVLRKWLSKCGSGGTYRRLNEAFWRARRMDLIEKTCSLLSSYSTNLQPLSSESVNRPASLHQSQVCPLLFHSPLLPHRPTDAVSGLHELRPHTDVPVNVYKTPTSIQLLPSLPPAPLACSQITATTRTSFQLQSYGSYLKSWYQAQVPSFALQWPPPPSTKIFNLAMIKKERVQRGQRDDEYVRLTITGRVNDILCKKVQVELKNIFLLDEKKRKVILIEGAPGSGKSTLSWDICQRWGAGELFQEFVAIILVQLRDPAIQAAKEIPDLIPSRNEIMSQEVAASIVACDGKGVLWVLDGWDEATFDYMNCSLVQMLTQSKLHESSVIVTSRPIASGNLQPLSSSRIEIVGFTPDMLRQYFSENLGGDCEAVEKLFERIRRNPAVEGSCYLPLNAAIIVHLFLSEGQSIPSTQYGIFSAVVRNCIFRHLKQRTEEGRQIQFLESLHSLPEVAKEPFKHLCKLAYRGVMKNKITFANEDFAAVNIPSSVSLLGLLQGVHSIVSAGRHISFNFLHLSIQELLAAFSISQLPSSKQILVFQQLFSEPRFSAVFQFYAAITKLQNPGIRSIITSIIESVGDSAHLRPLISLLNCLHAAQDLTLSQFVAQQLDRKLNFKWNTLTPLDCLAVGYFLSCVCVTTSGEFKVDLDHCSIDDYKFKFLTQDLCTCLPPTSTTIGWLNVNLSGNEITESGVQYLADILKHHSVMQTLKLGAQLIAFGYNGSDNPIQEKGLKCIADALVTNCSLVELHLRRCSLKITHESGPVLCHMLQLNKTLKVLYLSDNIVSDTGALFIAEGLKINTSLRELRLFNCSISEEGAELISGALQTNSSLEVLDLGWNELGDNGVSHLASVLKQKNHLRELILFACGMTHRSLKLLSQALSVNKSLVYLNLAGNVDISGTLSFLIEGLKKNSVLLRLGLPDNIVLKLSCIQEPINDARKRRGLPLIEVRYLGSLPL